MRHCFNKVFCLVILTALAACENASETVVGIPNVQVGCNTTDDPGCPANGSPTAFVRMSRSGCGDSINFEPIATGSVVMNCDSTGCDGVVTTWTNPETSDSVNEILTGRMDICSQVDLNDSGGSPDTGDLINEESRSINSSVTLTVETWEVAP